MNLAGILLALLAKEFWWHVVVVVVLFQVRKLVWSNAMQAWGGRALAACWLLGVFGGNKII